MVLLQIPRRCGCCCCGCCTCVLRQVQHEVQSVLTALSSLSVCFLLHFSRSASSARRWASPAPSSSRACSAALLAARQTRRLPLALRMCGPLSTRIHHALCHHVMCLFDTWHSACTEFAFSCCLLGLHLALVPLPGLSHRSRAPPGPQLLFLAQLVLPEHSFLSRSS